MMRRPDADIPCPVCKQLYKSRGIYVHVRSAHPDYKGAIMPRGETTTRTTPKHQPVAVARDIDSEGPLFALANDLCHVLLEVKLGALDLQDQDRPSLQTLRDMVEEALETRETRRTGGGIIHDPVARPAPSAPSAKRTEAA